MAQIGSSFRFPMILRGLAIGRARAWAAGLSLLPGGVGLLGSLLFIFISANGGATERLAD
ncbi:MAG TPA: hypothetical protein VKQ36_02590 [Ktedonobacterales bacterium]|nr:hypothetical protein [Ktedonobacterales bacterium]